MEDKNVTVEKLYLSPFSKVYLNTIGMTEELFAHHTKHETIFELPLREPSISLKSELVTMSYPAQKLSSMEYSMKTYPEKHSNKSEVIFPIGVQFGHVDVNTDRTKFYDFKLAAKINISTGGFYLIKLKNNHKPKHLLRYNCGFYTRDGAPNFYIASGTTLIEHHTKKGDVWIDNLEEVLNSSTMVESSDPDVATITLDLTLPVNILAAITWYQKVKLLKNREQGSVDGKSIK